MASRQIHKLLPGFIKADSHNLPVVDVYMMMEYIKQDNNFISPEIRNWKSARAGRESYGDSAVSYVQLKRKENECIVAVAVTPEHNVKNAGYRVRVNIDLQNSKIISVICEDCVASEGGCKHGLAMLAWIHRRSESKTVTDVEPYWKKSKLSSIGTTLKFIEASSITHKRFSKQNSIIAKTSMEGSFLKEVSDFLEESNRKKKHQ